MCTALIMSMERDIPAENITVGNISVRINKSRAFIFFGNTTIKQLPQPFTLSTEIFPPCASTMAFYNGQTNTCAAGFAVAGAVGTVEALKIRGMSSLAIPMP